MTHSDIIVLIANDCCRHFLNRHTSRSQRHMHASFTCLLFGTCRALQADGARRADPHLEAISQISGLARRRNSTSGRPASAGGPATRRTPRRASMPLAAPGAGATARLLHNRYQGQPMAARTLSPLSCMTPSPGVEVSFNKSAMCVPALTVLRADYALWG